MTGAGNRQPPSRPETAAPAARPNLTPSATGSQANTRTPAVMTGVRGEANRTQPIKSQASIDTNHFSKKHRRFEVHSPNQNRRHAAVGRLEPNVVPFWEVVFHGGFVADQRHDDVAAVSRGLLSDEDVVSVEDPRLDHRITGNAKPKDVAAA